MIQIAVKTLLIVGLHFLAVQSVLSQGLDLQNYVITQYGMEDGLPQSTVNDIIQSQDGYIWLATNGGLVRFDGNSFTTFNRANTPNMRFDRIIKLYEDGQGAIWIITESGMLRMKDGEFKPYLFSVGSIISSAREMVEDKNDVLWAIIIDKVYRYTDEGFVEVPVSRDPELSEKALNSDVGVWLVNNKELYKTIGDSVALIKDLSNEVGSDLLNIIEHPAGSGTFFIGTMSNGIVKYEQGNITIYDTENGLPANNFNAFFEDKSGNLFANVFGALAIWNGTNFERFDPIEEIGSIRFLNILEDNEGNYWMGTAADGLFRMRKSIIKMIDEKDGLKNEKMLAVMPLKDGSALFSTNCGGVYRWNDGQLSVPDLDYIADDGCFWSMFEDSLGRYWFGARGAYYTNSLSEPGTYLGTEEGFTSAEIFAITEDSKGNIWIASSDVLMVYNEGIIQRFTTENGLYYNDARSLFEDDDGTMWVGTVFGLHTIRDNRVKKIELIDYEKDDPNNRQPYIRAIHKDEDGIMWIGTYGHGIFRINDGRIDNITTAQGLFDNIVSHIIEDENKNFWMGSNRGISRVSKSDLNAVVAGEIDAVSAYSYGLGDGMNSAETNGGFQPSAFMDSLGQIYFPTVAGVAVVSTNDVNANEVPPPVYIENLRSNEGILSYTNSITLPYNTPYLQIQYTALNFTDPEKVKFKHRIKELNDNWIEAGSSRETIYSRIPPGEYTFQVIASNNDGVWNEEGASLAITVVPPFWQTTWFYTLISFLFLSIGPAIYYVRVNNLKKENERQKRFTEKLIDSQERERRRIASELHDGLGQQILVIKNRAELAQKLAKNPKELEGQLQEIMQSAVRSIGDVRSISHGLRPVHLEKFGLTESITNLCDQLQSTSSIEWSYHVDEIDEIIPKEKEIHFYRVLQEGVNNVLKHSSAKEASVMVRRTENGANAVLWDDGKGFDMKEKKSFGGLGFSGMRERIETLHGTLDIQSTIGEGTAIKIFIPAQQHG